MSWRKPQKHAEESSLPQVGVPTGQGPWVGAGRTLVCGRGTGMAFVIATTSLTQAWSEGLTPR